MYVPFESESFAILEVLFVLKSIAVSIIKVYSKALFSILGEGEGLQVMGFMLLVAL